VAGARPARAGGSVAADLDRSGAGAQDDRCVCPRAGGVPAGVQAEDVDPVLANRVRIAVYVRELERILEPGQLTIRVNVHLVESSTFEMAPRRGASISSLM
jgi:hypothetical protein